MIVLNSACVLCLGRVSTNCYQTEIIEFGSDHANNQAQVLKYFQSSIEALLKTKRVRYL